MPLFQCRKLCAEPFGHLAAPDHSPTGQKGVMWRSLFGWTSSKEKEVEPSKRQVKLDAKLAAKYGLQSGECTR